jgi:RNA polymerase sigma-70 factor, ECF subfamily
MSSDITYLLLQAGKGDLDAFDEVVRQTQHDVARFIQSLNGRIGAQDVAGTADIAQETFLRAWRSAPNFNGSSSGRTWLFGVARNVAADHRRRHARRDRIRKFVSLSGRMEDQSKGKANGAAHAGTYATADPDDGTRFDEHYALNALVDQLDPDRKEAFVLTQMVGLSYTEVAEICEVPIGTIRSRVARAREELSSAYRAAEQDHRAM